MNPRGYTSMSSHKNPAARADRAKQPTFAQSVMVAGILIWLLALLAGWLFGLGQAVLLAASLAIILLSLSVIGLQMTFGHDSDDAPKPSKRHHAIGNPSNPVAANSDATDDEVTLGALQGKRWSLDVFASIDAQRFAAVCETWFSWAGFDTRYESHRNQEGVDIWLHAARLAGPVAIVRCKHTQDQPVSLREMQDFQGVVANCKSAHGTFTTTSTYTPEALKFAREHDIEAVDGKALLRRILTRTRQSQQALLAVAYHGR